MNRISFRIGNHEIQLAVNSLGKECVYYDNVIVSEKLNFRPSYTHHFEVVENSETTKYDITFKSSLSGLVQCTVKRNSVLVKKDVISLMTPGLLRIFFFFIGLGLVSPSILLIYLKSYDSLFISSYDPSDLTLFYISQGIEFIFGILFLSFAFFLITILVRLPNLITTVLWIRIGLMIVSSPWVFADLMQGKTFLTDKLLGISLRVVGIWLFWFLLESSKAVSKMLKSQQPLQNNRND